MSAKLLIPALLAVGAVVLYTRFARGNRDATPSAPPQAVIPKPGRVDGGSNRKDDFARANDLLNLADNALDLWSKAGASRSNPTA